MVFDKEKEKFKIIEENAQRKIKYERKKDEYEEVKRNLDLKLKSQ